MQISAGHCTIWLVKTSFASSTLIMAVTPGTTVTVGCAHIPVLTHTHTHTHSHTHTHTNLPMAFTQHAQTCLPKYVLQLFCMSIRGSHIFLSYFIEGVCLCVCVCVYSVIQTNGLFSYDVMLVWSLTGQMQTKCFECEMRKVLLLLFA